MPASGFRFPWPEKEPTKGHIAAMPLPVPVRNRFREMLVWACTDGGVVVGIDELERTKKQKRIALWCPECEEPLTPVQGEKMAHHFRHPEGSKCDAAAGGEGPLHTNAKLMLQRALSAACAADQELVITTECAQCIALLSGERMGPPRTPTNWHASRVTVASLRLRSTDEVRTRQGNPDLQIVRDGSELALVEVFVERPTPNDQWARLAERGSVIEVPAIAVLGVDEVQDWNAARPLPASRWSGASVRCPECEAWWTGPLVEHLRTLDVRLYLPSGDERVGNLDLRRTWSRGQWCAELSLQWTGGDGPEVLATWSALEASSPEKLLERARAEGRTWKDSVLAESVGAHLTFERADWPISKRTFFAWNGHEWIRVIPKRFAQSREDIENVLGQSVPELVDRKTGQAWYVAADYDRLCRELAKWNKRPRSRQRRR